MFFTAPFGGLAKLRKATVNFITSFRLYVCLSVRLSDYLSVCLSICLSVHLSICPSVCPSVYLYVCLSVRLFVYLSVCLSVRLSLCPSVYLFACLSVRLSICPFAYLFACLSACLSLRMEQIDSHWTYLHDVIFQYFFNSVENSGITKIWQEWQVLHVHTCLHICDIVRLEWEMFQTKGVEKIKTQNLCSISFP